MQLLKKAGIALCLTSFVQPPGACNAPNRLISREPETGLAERVSLSFLWAEHPDSKSTCNVCIEEFVNTETFAMRCGHRYVPQLCRLSDRDGPLNRGALFWAPSFCIGCWKAFLSSEIQNGSASGANCLNSTCP